MFWENLPKLALLASEPQLQPELRPAVGKTVII